MFNVESRPLMSRQEMLLSGVEAAPNAEAYVNAHATQAFDRTTTGRGMEEYSIMRAEKNEGTWDEGYAQGQATQEFTGPFAGMQPPEHKHAMSEEDWKKSEYYVPTIKYRPDMTLTRARIQKENYDQRRYLEHIVHKGDDAFGLGMKVLGFGASLVGSLPDPINIIPFSGGMKAASVSKGVLKGAVEGAVGNAAVSALVLPDLANKGEDVGFADALLDTAFGALLGGALGGLGGYFGKRRADAVEQHTADMYRAKGTRFGQDLVQGKVAFTQRAAGDAGTAPFLPRNDMADILRAGARQQDRHNFKLGMEKALADIHADRPVDVASFFENTPTISKVQYQHFVSQLEQADEFTNVRFGQVRPDLRDALNSIRTEEGVALLDGENLIIPANVVKKFHEKRMLEGKMSPDEVGQLLLDVFHRDADFVSNTKYPHIQAVVAIRGELSRVGFISTDPKTSEIVIKTGYKKETPKLIKSLGGKQTRSGGARNPSSGDADVSAPFAAPRLSALQNEVSLLRDINAPRADVNYAVERSDNFSPAPALREETLALHEELGLDEQTGLLPEESLVNELDSAGRVAPEDRDALLAAQEQAGRVQDYDDIGQSIIPCILEVGDGK